MTFKIIEKIAEFMKALLDEIRTRHAEQRSEHDAMSRNLNSILALVTAQGQQIDQLVAQRDAAEQADLDAIGSAIEANTAKMTAALAGTSEGQAKAADAGAPITAVVTAPTGAGSHVVPVAQVAVGSVAAAVDSASALGASVAVSGPGIAAGTTVVSADPTASTITLSAPLETPHVGDGTEQLTVTPAPASPVQAAA